MNKVTINSNIENIPQLINQVTETGERIVIEQKGRATVAIISYDDLRKLELLEAMLLNKAQEEEYQLLKSSIRNPAFASLNDEAEDIYTLADGKPFHDLEVAQSILNNPDYCSITDPKEDIYTLSDGIPFHDQG